MRVFMYLEESSVRGGIEVFAERHAARLRAEGHEVTVGSRTGVFDDYDEIVVHKCSDVATLEKFPPEKTTYYVHDHEPICPRSYAYTPLGRNCSRASGLWPCLLCAPACRAWKAALGRVFAQARRKRAMARFRKIVVISEFMKSRLVANGLTVGKIVVEPPKIESLRVSLGSDRVSLGSDRVSLGSDRVGLGADRVGLGADRVSLGSDRVSLGSDRVGLGSDRVSLVSDRVSLVSDRVSLGSDRVSLGSDRVRLGSDRVSLGSDRVGLGSDRVGLGADRVRLGSDRVSLVSDRVADTNQTLKDSTKTLKDPTLTLKDPTLTLKDSTLTLKDPTLTLIDPNSPAVDLLYVGQLIRGKGVQLLLKAMSLMKTPRTLDVVGTGNMEPKLKALAASLGLADRVRFRGFQDSPREWMLAAKCVVVPSFWQEPYGLVAAEAVALNRPVVAFAIGGLPEACQGKATLVPPGDVAALAAALDVIDPPPVPPVPPAPTVSPVH